MFRKLYHYYSNIFLKGFILSIYYRVLIKSFKLFGVFAKVSLSQYSEDVIIGIILKGAKRKKGIFVDVGCNHPIGYNNTYLLYLQGRRGINIDGNKNLMTLYDKYRKGDTNLNLLISNKEEEVVFNISDRDKLSTVEQDVVKVGGEKTFPDSLKVKMRTKTLDSVLEQHLKNDDVQIDLLCVDVEGHDFEVLSSINLDKWKPYLIVVEMQDFSLNYHANHRNYILLTEKGYRLEHFVLTSGYFVRN